MISKNVCNYFELSKIKGVRLVKPTTMGSQWQGIRHGDLLEAVFASIAVRGGKVSELRAFISNDKMDMHAAIAIEDGPLMPIGFKPWIGITTSNSRRKSMRFFAGITDEKDTPLVMSATQVLHKRTINFELIKECDEIVREWKHEMKGCHPEIRAVKGCQITADNAVQTLFMAGRRNIIPWSRVGKVDNIFKRTPSKTGWTLLEAFHSVNMLAPAAEQMQRNICFCQLLPIRKREATDASASP